MPVNWTIGGETGQGWDESVTTLEARNISSAKLDFKSLDADEFKFNVMLKDAANPEYVATPAVSPDSSVQIGSSISVTVTCATAGATIRYTTNGSNPNSSSPVVANGATLTIANPSTLKVFAEKAGLLDSDTKVAQYVVQGVLATGGSVTDTTGFRTHTFLASDSFVVTNPGTIEYLVVAGGGSGGGNSSTRSGGGGGAGGFKTGSIAVTAGTYAITVGAGGMALVPQAAASDGGGSSIGTLVTCSGGGGGASVSGTTAVAGRAGGSGGGGTGGGDGGTGISGQGRNGGGSASITSGTGGGSDAAGVSRSTAIANGGAGTASSITGTAVTYSVGGGISLTPDNSVVPNTGRGGAAMFESTTTTRTGANGSSGIVVIKYARIQAPAPSNIPSSNTEIPTLRQEVTLYRDGVRFFFGNVTDVRSIISNQSNEFQITVSGPWWWLERIPFTSIIADGTGVSQERISYVFGTDSAGQSLNVSIQNAINRSVELGAPLATIAQGSSVDSMFVVPRITMNQSTCGQVISELVRICPDTMVWFDYTSKPAKIKVNRRGAANATSFDANTSPVTSIDINPIIDLEVSSVTLPYVDRNVKGNTIFKVQSAGTNIATKRQVITISGPELDTFLPNNLFDVTLVRKTDIRDYVFTRNGRFRSFDVQYGFNPIGESWPAGITASTINFWSNNEGFTITNYKIPAASVPGGHYYLFGTDGTSSAPAWAVEDYDIKSSNISGGIYGRFTHSSGETWKSQRSQDFFALFGNNWWTSGSSVYAGCPIKDNLTVDYSQVDFSSSFINPVFKVQARTSVGSSIYSTITLTADAPDMDLTNLDISYKDQDNYTQYKVIDNYNRATRQFTLYVGNDSNRPIVGSTLTTNVKLLYRKSDYSFIFPPANLAQNLLNAQNWIPYEGNISLEQEDAGGTRYRGTKVNILNSLSQFSDMGALVVGESIEIETGRTEIKLGAPARNDYRNLVDKIRKTSQDNIIYL
jgi:hypothetical protein